MSTALCGSGTRIRRVFKQDKDAAVPGRAEACDPLTVFESFFPGNTIGTEVSHGLLNLSLSSVFSLFPHL